MKIISGTKTSEDVNRVKEKREKSRHQSGKRKPDKNRRARTFPHALTECLNKREKRLYSNMRKI